MARKTMRKSTYTGEQTIYRWKKMFGDTLPSEVKKLRQLEEENKRLKQLAENLIAVYQVSVRRACRLVESIRGIDVVSVLGKPEHIRFDNSPEFISKDTVIAEGW